MATGNKLRPKKTCSLTYNINGLIPPSEAKLTTNYLKKIHDLKILIVNSLTSDAIAQISNDTNIKYFQCFVHRLRTIQNSWKNIQFLKLPAGYKQDIFRQKLLDLVRIKKKYTAQETFVTRTLMAIKKSLSHVSVDHTLIVQRDPWLDTQYLFPSIGSYLSLVTEERRKLESVITKSLSTEILNKIARLQDRTNQCQSLHHRVFINAPKSVLCKKILMDTATQHAIPLHLEWGNHQYW